MKKRFIPLNIQLFAENDGENGGGNDPQPKTYSEEEYNKLKVRIDELTKNEKNYKEQLKAKMTEEEKQKEAQESTNKEIEDLKKENQRYKIAKELAVGGFEDKQIEQIAEHIIEGNAIDLCKVLSTYRKELVEQITKQVKAELQKQNKLPNGSGSEEEIDDDVQKIINKNKKNTNKARDYYFGSKK